MGHMKNVGMYTKRPPKESHLLREWVRYQLRLKGLSWADLAKQHGGRRDQPCRAFNISYPKWEKIIAATLDMKPEELWPERFKERAARALRGESTRISRYMQ